MPPLRNGMLWLCEKKTLSDDIAAAAKYHQEKYGPVNTVHVNADYNDPVWDNNILSIVLDHSLRPDTIWIGWAEPIKAVTP